MTIYASKSKCGFFTSLLHSEIPTDAVEISGEYHNELMYMQSQGKIIDWSGDLPVAIDPPAPTFEQEVQFYRNAAQQHLDNVARQAGYDDIKTAVTYAEEPAIPVFQQQGKALRAWRSVVWAFAYDLLDKVSKGEVQKPSMEEFVALLPTVNWEV